MSFKKFKIGDKVICKSILAPQDVCLIGGTHSGAYRTIGREGIIFKFAFESDCYFVKTKKKRTQGNQTVLAKFHSSELVKGGIEYYLAVEKRLQSELRESKIIEAMKQAEREMKEWLGSK